MIMLTAACKGFDMHTASGRRQLFGSSAGEVGDVGMGSLRNRTGAAMFAHLMRLNGDEEPRRGFYESFKGADGDAQNTL